MIKKKITSKGFTIYEIDSLSHRMLQRVRLFGNECDGCNKEIEGVIYVPVLHYGFCEECFKEWYEEATYCDADSEYEQERSKLLEKWLEYLYIDFETIKVENMPLRDTERNKENEQL